MYKRDRYPPNWQELSHTCKQQARWHCEECHIAHGGERTSKRTGLPYQVYLHAAHVMLHDTQNPRPVLKALCPTCHGRLDWRLRKQEKDVSIERVKHRLLLLRK